MESQEPMTRKLSAFEVKVTLANVARIPPDDLDGYVLVLVKGAEVAAVVTNAATEGAAIAVLARAIEHRAAVVGKFEEQVELERG